MDITDAELAAVTREVRLLVIEDDEHLNGYAALHHTEPEGQWALWLDGSWGTSEERRQVLADIWLTAASYLSIPRIRGATN